MEISCLNLNCMSPKECSPFKVLAFGNLLVGYKTDIVDRNMLQRHRLSLNARMEMDINTFSEISSNISVNEGCQVELGGSALHTTHVLKQMGTEVLFFSACGDDRESAVVADLLKKSDIDTSHLRIQTVIDAPTGRRISLCHNDSRALYTCSGASSKFSVNYLQFVMNEESSTILRPLNRVQIFYVEGFFVPHREAVTTYIVRNYIEGRRYLALNLSADYIVRETFDHMLYLVHNALFIFGNKAEFETFCQCWGAENIRQLAEGLVKNQKVPKIFVVTKGAEGVELISNWLHEGCAPGPLSIQTFNVSPAGDSADTTGSGDAFVAGFLHAWLDKRQLSQCVRIGCYYAGKEIKNGCRLSAPASMQ